MRRRSVRRLRAALVACALVAGYAVADAQDVVPGVLTTSPAAVAAAPRPTPSDPARTAAAPVLPGLSDQAPTPTTGGLTRTLKPLLGAAALGGHVSASVVDDATGTQLLGRDAGSARAPASTAKLLTGVAVLSAVGGATTLPTTVVQGAGADEVVLVGGGDMMLGTGASKPRSAEGRAGLGTLARQVADALSREGRTRVAVRFDDSLFTGGTVAPGWAAVDIGYGLTGRVAALGLDRDRAVPGHPAPADLALSAARAFASALDAAGISVTGAPVRTKAPAGARQLGLVRSAPVQDVLSVALHESDNALAEGLAHLTARAVKRPATFADAPQAVLDQVQHVGIDTGPTVLLDGSGLTRGSLVPAAVLTDVLRAAGSREHPELRPLLDGLPVAGFSGTLAGRFTERPARDAAGEVRAKTGTLTGINTLAGVTVDADGRLLVFAVLADHVPTGGTDAARHTMDRIAAALADCGCR
ncbi:D-alanyl-D-alanine carboxypeptidase/D-alanyl-D-alanine endopeptidase [Angustibacter aerolatus]